MKSEVSICDSCKTSIAITKCDLCECDLCNKIRCKTEKELFLFQTDALICRIVYCSKCRKDLTWEGELSEDIKEIIMDKIKSRRLLNKIEDPKQ